MDMHAQSYQHLEHKVLAVRKAIGGLLKKQSFRFLLHPNHIHLSIPSDNAVVPKWQPMPPMVGGAVVEVSSR